MTSAHEDLDDTIRSAVQQHGAAIHSAIPEFGDLIAVRHRRSRRLLAGATAAVALVGIAGVIVATNRPTPGQNTAASNTPSTETPGTRPTIAEPRASTAPTVSTPVPTTPLTVPLQFLCSDPLGEDRLGRQLFGACEPAPSEVEGDYACVGRIGTDDGFIIFESCEPVGQLGPLPADDSDAPFDNPDDLPVRRTVYVVGRGDYGIKVADEFCVLLGDLEAANGWSDAATDFPGPGSEILIPNGFSDASCDLGSYTIEAEDSSRNRVAEKFCVSVGALDTANIDTVGYDAFFPGLVIVIPPSSRDVC